MKVFLFAALLVFYGMLFARLHISINMVCSKHTFAIVRGSVVLCPSRRHRTRSEPNVCQRKIVSVYKFMTNCNRNFSFKKTDVDSIFSAKALHPNCIITILCFSKADDCSLVTVCNWIGVLYPCPPSLFFFLRFVQLNCCHD